MEYMFCSFVSMATHLDQPIQTEQFLNCCRALSEMFDKLSASAFSPIKSGFNTNIKLINDKYLTDKKRYSTLEAILKEEKGRNYHTSKGSASTELLWLTRSLIFVSELFDNIEDKPTFYAAITAAYEASVKQYHNFLVVGKAAPSKEVALEGFTINKGDTGKPGYTGCLYDSMYTYNDALSDVCSNIEDMFQKEADITIMHRPPS
ncbi:PLEKHA8 [Bugula neritina]|uniref:PLEKHA8 n=1 Tax=Bugula neritina TaxID=10212 RepID=A0A7J7KIN9_BUGNE|nr:PLEKHA8 [Bugula neritina]